jgi:hypothetical protein
MRHGMVMKSSDSNSSAPKSLTAKSLDAAILEVLARPDVKTLSAPEVANAIAADGDWHDLLVPIRSTAVALAQAGRLVIYRKGKPVDPADFRGVYRLGLPRHD